MERRQSLQQVVLGKQDSPRKSMKLEHTLSPYRKKKKKKKNSKWLKNINKLKHDIIKNSWNKTKVPY